MTNLSTSEVLEKYAPEFLALDEAERNYTLIESEVIGRPVEEVRETLKPLTERYSAEAFFKTRALLDAFAQTLLNLERAKEVFRFYENPPKLDQDGERLSVPDFYDEMDFGENARAALSYIEERKE